MAEPDCDAIVAVDLGGTSIRFSAIRQNKIIGRTRMLTHAREGVSVVVNQILEGIQALSELVNIRADDILGIGVGAPGLVDRETGVVRQAPNLLGWVDIPLRDLLQHALKVPTIVANDAMLSCLGEHGHGAGHGTQEMIYMTIGTGIGGGVITGGKLLYGVSGSAGHIGHICIDASPNALSDTAGHVGCLEAYGSGTAIARRANALIASGAGRGIIRASNTKPLTNLTEIPDTDTHPVRYDETKESVTARDVVKAAKSGDAEAAALIQEAARAIGLGCVTLVHCFNPEVIVIGGGVAQAGDMLFNPIREVVQQGAFTWAANVVRIVPSTLGDDAAAMGTVVLMGSNS